MKAKRDLAAYIILFVVLAVLPLFLHGNRYLMHVLIMSLIWGSIVGYWDLIMGYAGIFSFGQIAFFVFGAYAAGILTKMGVSPWLGILLGGALAGLIGTLVALPCLNLSGVSIALITFALHMVAEPLIKACEVIGTGGAGNLSDIPRLAIGKLVFTVDEKIGWFYLMFATAAFLYLILYKIIHSNIGLAFVALRDSDVFAASLGVDAYRYKLAVFAVSASFTGIIGGLYLQYVGIISTKILGIDTFLMVLVMIIIGGLGQFPGTMIGALIITFLSSALRPLEQYRLMTLGAIIVLSVLFMPQGVMGLIGSKGPSFYKLLDSFLSKKKLFRESNG